MTLLEGMGVNLRRVFRKWRGSPGVALPIVAMLATGTSAAITFISMVNGTLFPSMGVAEPDRLVRVFSRNEGATGSALSLTAISYPDYLDLSQQADIFHSFAVYLQDKVYVRSGLNASESIALIVSPNYFATLGVRPYAGRLFSADHGDNEAVLSYGYCVSRFGDPAGCNGKDLVINRQVYRVVGVAPQGFYGIQPGAKPEIWLALKPNSPSCGCAGDVANNRRMRRFSGVGRLRDRTRVEQADALLKVVANRLKMEYPATNAQTSVVVLPLRDAIVAPQLRPQVLEALWRYGLLSGLLLALTAFNSSSLLAAHAISRMKEFATRLSLGASPGKILLETSVDNGALAALGVGLGFALALILSGASQDLLAANSSGVPLSSQFDLRMVLWVGLLLLVLPLICGLIPAWPMRKLHLASVLRESGGLMAAPGAGRLRVAMLALQLAICIGLTGAAGTSMDNLLRLKSAQSGSNFDRIIQFRINGVAAGYAGERSLLLVEQVRERILAIPGVEAMGAALSPPLNPMQGAIRAKAAGQFISSEAGTGWLRANFVTPGYFEMLSIPLIAGRRIEARDGVGGEPGVVVNQTLARLVFGVRSPVGEYLELPDESRSRAQIVGVTADTKYQKLAEGPQPYAYLPFAQSPVPAFEVLVKYSPRADGPGVIRSIREAIHDLDPSLPLIGVQPLSAQIDRSLSATVALLWLAGAVGLAALIIVTTGVMASVALVVTQRKREAGVRMAIGADEQAIWWLLARQILWAAGAATALGLLLHYWLGRALESFVHGTVARPGVTAMAAVAVVLASTVLATHVRILPILQTTPRRLIEGS